MADYPRALLLLAAVLWSLSSLFMRVLSEPTSLGLAEPHLTPLQIAFFRGLFAGLFLVPFLKPAQIRVRPRMLAMVLCFGLMSGLYLSALGLGSAANAILLQNTSPFWCYLIGVYCLGEVKDLRNRASIFLGLLGALVIVVGNWPWGQSGAASREEILVLIMAVGSGITYAGIMLFLCSLRGESSAWLTVLNLLGSATVLAIYVWLRFGTDEFLTWLSMPTGRQLAWIALFGAVQMATPYWLFATGLRKVGPQEAGIITLLEPILNPVWAYMMVPQRETPTIWTILGGLVLLAALIWRYRPQRRQRLVVKT
jgi:drug/metabolite transporter, DME family